MSFHQIIGDDVVCHRTGGGLVLIFQLNPSTGREYLMKNSCPIPG